VTVGVGVGSGHPGSGIQPGAHIKPKLYWRRIVTILLTDPNGR
jgi:hypothetical protein